MHRLLAASLLAVAAALLTVGCLPEEGEDATDTESDSDSDTYDPDCHYDCFSRHTCEDGVVYYQPGGPIPCEVGGAELCDRGDQVGECEQGCRTDIHSQRTFDPDEWAIMCEEHRPREVGESCTTDDDCSPAETYVDDATGEDVEKDLECDTDAGECVDPRLPDYLAYCDADTSGADGDAGYLMPGGNIALSGCAADSYCYVAEAEGESCQSCTIVCESDADCPAGSVCSEQKGITLDHRDRIDLCVPEETPFSQNSPVECRPVE